MSDYTITIDTAERAATPAHDCGVFRLRCTEANVRQQAEALVQLGFTPKVEMTPSTYEFDVFTAHHDEIKGGGDYREVWSRVVVSAMEFPTYGRAAEAAACLAVAVHGGMPVQVLARY